MVIKNKKNISIYINSFIMIALSVAISALSYNNDTPSLDISLQFNNSTLSNSSVDNLDLVKDFIYSSFSPKEITLAISCIIMALNAVNYLMGYLNTKFINEKEKVIENLNTELERLTNQAQSVQLNVRDEINVEANYVPSRIHSYNLSHDRLPLDNLSDGIPVIGASTANEPFELDSNAIMESTRTSIYPSPVEIRH